MKNHLGRMDKGLNTIQLGDCIELLKKSKNISPKLIFADTPFNIGYDYETYQDNLEYENYVNWTSYYKE